MPEPARSSVAEAVAAAGGMCVFALFAHRPLPLAILAGAGLLDTALSLTRAIRSAPSPAASLGLRAPLAETAAWAIGGVAFGSALAIALRAHLGWPLLPERLARFAVPATLIGATEEFFYRGYIQGRVRLWGRAGAVVVAAFFHTAYKVCLFALPPAPVEIDLLFLGALTFAAGAVLGLLREASGSVYPPAAGHALFDILVYGARTGAPWWVWS